jgi:Tol biopolymer transport system component
MRHLCLVLCMLLAGALNAQGQGAKPAAHYYNPDWSRDGSKIVFESTRDGKFAIYVIQADGSNLRKLTSGEANDEQPRWSLDGRQIVFISDRDGHLQLYVMDADGSHQRRLTNGEDIDYAPAFSPKGDWVAFMSRPERASVVHDIYVIRADGTGRTRLTDQSTNDTSPLWSPDGKKILFVRSSVIKKYYRDMSKEEREQMKNSEEVFIMNRDGSNPRNLTNNSFQDRAAHWSRAGKDIYFLSERDGLLHVYVMKADGSKARRQVDGKTVTDPNISPDGKYFAYTKEVDNKWGLYIYELKSGKERLLIGG